MFLCFAASLHSNNWPRQPPNALVELWLDRCLALQWAASVGLVVSIAWIVA